MPLQISFPRVPATRESGPRSILGSAAKWPAESLGHDFLGVPRHEICVAWIGLGNHLL